MKLKTNHLVKTILEPEEMEAFLIAVAHDQIIVSTLLRIIEAKADTLDNRFDLVEKVTYATERAYLDGRLKELGWLYTLLEGGSDQ